MANVNGPTLVKSSPHSSDEASHHDTPSTNLTVFSPESDNTATKPRPKFNVVIAETDVPCFNFGGDISSYTSNDPFTNLPTPTSARNLLSPTADVFAPGQYIAPRYISSSGSYNAFHVAGGSMQSANGGCPVTRRRAPHGAIGDQPQHVNLCHSMQSLSVNLTNFQHSEHFRDGTIFDGSFTTDEANTRAFMVTGLSPRDTDFCRASAQFPLRVYPSRTGIDATKLRHGMIIVHFTNYHDARVAYANAQKDHPDWRMVRLSPKAYALRSDEFRSQGRVDVAHVSDFEGQVIVSVYFNGRDDSIKAEPTFEMLEHTLSTFGELKAFHSMPYQQAHVREIRAEYYDTRHAENAVRSFNHTPLGSIVVSIEHYQPDVQVQDDTRPSVTGRSTVPFNDPASNFRFSFGSYASSSGNDRGRNNHYDVGGNHNRVDIHCIQLGLDVRTTVMLRNIPNKVNQAMLKAILDETSHGDYDFAYLRIDFANNCNVGYAFINFVDALAILPFALARAGQKWNAFNSDKVAEISYATIQGKDCLIQKFRNSSVMLECPTFRPKLYITGNGPDAGEEEQFPPPDNPSKMRRSVENAEHVGLFRHSSGKHKKPLRASNTHGQHLLPASGLHSSTTTMVDRSNQSDLSNGIASSSLHPSLFAPRQGQMYREEQRRRRSQYDRGTPGAESEAHTQYLTGSALPPHPIPIPSYSAPGNASHYANLHYALGAPGPSTWYLDDY